MKGINMEEIKSALLEILEELHPDIDFNTNEKLIDEKILDSFDIITLISEVSEEFDVSISADKIIPENFNSLESLCNLINNLIDGD